MHRECKGNSTISWSQHSSLKAQDHKGFKEQLTKLYTDMDYIPTLTSRTSKRIYFSSHCEFFSMHMDTINSIALTGLKLHSQWDKDPSLPEPDHHRGGLTAMAEVSSCVPEVNTVLSGVKHHSPTRLLHHEKVTYTQKLCGQ